MALSDQFKRCVVAVFPRSDLRANNDYERAVAAVNICKVSFSRFGYLTRASEKKHPSQMRQTAAGRKRSRVKRGDKGHWPKMKTFWEIWDYYLEAQARGITVE